MRTRAQRAALAMFDGVLAGAVVTAGAIVLLARTPLRRVRRAAPSRPPRLLVINSIYTLAVMRARGAEHFVTHRDLDGYFDHVWTVHPLVGAEPDSPAESALGPPAVTELTPTHTMIEGRVRRFAALRRLPFADFGCAQLQLVLMLDRIVRREGVGIVRGDPYYHGLLALLLARLHGCAAEVRVVGNHDAIYEASGSLAYPRLLRWRAVERRVAHFVFSRADAVVTGSDDNRTFALRNGARPERVTSLTNATMINPVHQTEPAARAPVADEFGFGARRVVICVSRLERMKHPEDVVRSVATAHGRDPLVAAVIVGDGAMRAELEALCAELGVQDVIAFAGGRDQSWIASMLSQSAVIAVPLAGLALVEAALSGTPIAGYDVEWHSELLRSPEEALLVPYRDTDALADALCALAGDREHAARVGAAARARALEFMQPAQLIARERALADRLLAMSPATAS